MSTVAAEPMTAEEFWEWAQRPENQERRLELVDGRVVEMPPPGVAHGAVCNLVAFLLTQYAFQRRTGFVCTNVTGLLVAQGPDSLRGPDVMYFSEGSKFDDLSSGYADKMPALVVEVQSPSDQTAKLNRRISQYQARGVPLVWLVDPESRTVSIYRPHELLRVLDDTEDLTGDLAPAEFRCRVADLLTLPAQGP